MRQDTSGTKRLKFWETPRFFYFFQIQFLLPEVSCRRRLFFAQKGVFQNVKLFVPEVSCRRRYFFAQKGVFQNLDLYSSYLDQNNAKKVIQGSHSPPKGTRVNAWNHPGGGQQEGNRPHNDTTRLMTPRGWRILLFVCSRWSRPC